MSLIGCQSNQDNRLDDLVSDNFQFNIFKYEINSVINLFLERYGLKETDAEAEEIKKLLMNELYEQNMNYIFNIIFPPPEFTVGNSPKLLVTSPRNKIERNSELLLDSSLNIETIEMLEKKIEESENLSSVIIDIGGIAAYPAIIKNNKNPRDLFLTFSHEWLHQYLIFYPLGKSYFADTKMKEINETLANIFSYKLLEGLCNKDFELKKEICMKTVTDKSKFDYSKFMKKLREDVDVLLAEGKIIDAEKLMNEAKISLSNNGIKIRKLNQAWFAFNGTYADSPTSISNIDKELNKIIDSYDDLRSAIDDIKAISSLDEFNNMIKDNADIKK